MTNNAQIDIKTLSVFLGSFLIVLVGLLLVRSHSLSMPPSPTATPTIQPLSRVQIGDSRDEAVVKLSEGAWYHADCTTISGDDLFFYGDEGRQSDIVVMESTGEEHTKEVERIYELQEMSWLNLYRDCVPEEIIETQLP